MARYGGGGGGHGRAPPTQEGAIASTSVHAPTVEFWTLQMYQHVQAMRRRAASTDMSQFLETVGEYVQQFLRFVSMRLLQTTDINGAAAPDIAPAVPCWKMPTLTLRPETSPLVFVKGQATWVGKARRRCAHRQAHRHGHTVTQ